MKVLNKDELQVAEGILLKHFPRSYKVYGFLYTCNRNKPNIVEVVVDSWPEFKVILLRPDPKNKRSEDFMKKVSFFSTDEEVLRKLLSEEVDWSTYFIIGGFDISHAPTLKEVSSEKKVNNRSFTLVHLMYLPDMSHLRAPDVDSQLESRISSLSLSHIDMVNKTWKFGGDEKGYRHFENIISNFPTCCILDTHGVPVAWILM